MSNIFAKHRTVWIKTFGCQMNYHDSERILSYLQEINFTKTEDRETADLILFNTCAIRDLANSKFYSNLGEIKHQKKERSELLVGIAGCISQTDGLEILKKYKHLDFAFGTDAIDQINEMIYRLYLGENKFFINSRDRSNNYSIETRITHGSPQAFVNIIKGCDNFCSYCIVPFTRGREKSRKIAEIVNDIKNLVENKGIQEITLLGQNVNSFGKENGENLAQLILELEKIDGLLLLRYTTSHPKDLSDDLINVYTLSKKLSNHLHLPIQSGSDTVLDRMNRGHTTDYYLKLLEKIRNTRSDIVITSDIIVGFPNETEVEYQETLKFLEQANFDFVYSYAFSPRANTKAAEIEDCLTDEIRNKRLVKMQRLQDEIQRKIRRTIIGQKMVMLLEGKNTKDDVEKWFGRTRCNRLVHVKMVDDTIDYQWKWIEVEIVSTTPYSCQGKLIRQLY